MSVLEAIRIALTALTANIMRSVLTTLGVVIGVGAVIAMTALGQGASQDVQSRINKLGSNLIFVSPGKAQVGRIFMGFGSADTITIDDAAKLRRQFADITGVAPEVSGNVQVKVGGSNNNYRVTGTYSDYGAVRNVDLAMGRFFSRPEEEAGRRVCVIGSNVAGDVFKGKKALGSRLKLKGIPFEVVGIMTAIGGFGRQDDQVFIPLKTFALRIGYRKYVSVIAVSGKPELKPEAVMENLTRWFRREHKLRPAQPDDFSVASQNDIASTLGETNKIFTMLLAGIAAISLLVGGIGIMNIMLVTVTERTREIGIRKALGARRSDIQLQFLIESMVLSVLGGSLGVLLGVGVSRIVQAQGLTMVITTRSVLLSFGCAASIGIFFGFYPASRAASLDPIQALRYE